MRPACGAFHLRKSIPLLYSNICRWGTNNQLSTDQPAKRGTSSFCSRSTERMSSTATAQKTPVLSDSNIIWIDMEMTGLDHEKECILEAACLITDKHINIIAEGPNIIIHQPLEKLNAMDEWCLEHHTKSGLFKESLQSKMSIEQAEDELLKFVQQYTPPGKCPLAGNTVYMDKLFLLKHMPRLCKHLHYRILDVSSIKILAKSWYNLDPPDKKWRHRALDDIKESIRELTHYQNSIFKPMKLMSGIPS